MRISTGNVIIPVLKLTDAEDLPDCPGQDQEPSHLGSCHSPFLVSSWQVTWVKVMSRRTVIPEHSEVPMPARQTCSFLKHSRRGSQREPDLELQHPDWKIQISLSGTGSWLSDYCKLKQAAHIPPSCSALLLSSTSKPTSTSGSEICFEWCC